MLSLARELRRAVLFGAEELGDERFVLRFVALFETDLRVSNDATCVHDVRRSAEGVLLAQLGVVAVENRVRDLHFTGELARGLGIRVHRDRENLQALRGIFLVQILEMDHLLARKRSVT